MSIPGLGQIPVQTLTSSTTRTVTLRPAWEWRFQVPFDRTVVVKVRSGTAEKDGVELAPGNAYSFSGVVSKVLSWHGCELVVEGRCSEDSVAEFDLHSSPGAKNPAMSHVNFHARLTEMRRGAATRTGPRVLVAGPPASGKSCLVRTLASYATRQGYEPIVVNADPGEGMLSLPGSLSASVFASVMDPEAVDGWGPTPTSGPSVVPVKLPLVYCFGHRSAEDDADFYKVLTSKLASTVSGRLSEDEAVRKSGLIVDTMGAGDSNIDLLAHVVDELSVNIIVVLGDAAVQSQLAKRFATERTSLDEPIHVVGLDRPDGVVQRDETYLERAREQAIKEYFYGDGRKALSPQIQQVDFDALVIYKPSDATPHEPGRLLKHDPSSVMEHWTLAIMYASVKDPPEVVRVAAVMGYVYVSNVDENRRKIKLLAPVGGRLGDRPLILGTWPEPYMNLLG